MGVKILLLTHFQRDGKGFGVHRHAFESEEDKGTKFTITFCSKKMKKIVTAFRSQLF